MARGKGETAEATPPEAPAGAASSATGLKAPASAASMDRHDDGRLVDPVQVLAAIEVSQMREMREMNVRTLAEFFEHLGLKEIPDKVLDSGLNGAILHSVTTKDIDKLDFKSLGEAKALENLCKKLNQIERQDQREVAIMTKPVVFWGTRHQWIDGPISICNRCSMKDHRSGCDVCWDSICCSPKQFVALPESEVLIFRDHLQLKYPRWRDHIADRYRKLDHAFADSNEPPFKIQVDNIDFSQIQDVDVEDITKQEEYVMTFADCCNTCLGKDLRREPNMGDFYWVGPCQRLCGFDLFYKERPDGYITISLRNEDQHGDVRKIGVVEGSKEVAKAILHYQEEAQMLRQVKLT